SRSFPRVPTAHITDSRSFHGLLLDCRPEGFAARSQPGIPPLVLGGGMALSAPAIPADTFLVGQAATDKSLKPASRRSASNSFGSARPIQTNAAAKFDTRLLYVRSGSISSFSL